MASGECDIGVTNSYYLARMMRSNKPEDVAVVNKVGVVFPNQASWGTHLNIAGVQSPNTPKQGKRRQVPRIPGKPRSPNYFANGNNEWPAVKSVTLDNPALKAMTAMPLQRAKPFPSVPWEPM